MSIRVMSKVWELSEQKGSKLLLLLAIADHAADDGYCWPGTKTLAKKIRMSVRSVLRAIKTLESAGELHVIRGNVNNRYVVMAGLTQVDLHSVLVARKAELPPTGDKLSPVKLSPGDTGGATGDTCVTSEVTQPCHPNHHESSSNHQDQESAVADEPLPHNFPGWHTYIREAENASQTVHRLRQMCKELYPGLDPPSHGYIGKVAKRLHAGRLADLLWQHSSRPPTGDLLSYIQGAAKNGKNRGNHSGLGEGTGEKATTGQAAAIAAAFAAPVTGGSGRGGGDSG